MTRAALPPKTTLGTLQMDLRFTETYIEDLKKRMKTGNFYQGCDAQARAKKTLAHLMVRSNELAQQIEAHQRSAA